MTTGMVTASDVERYSPMFNRIATRTARAWPGFAVEDLEQTIWVELLPKWRSLTGDDRLMEAAASRVARAHCIKERYDFMMASSEYVYTPAEVRALFKECFFDEGARENLPDHHDTVYAGGVACGIWDLDATYEKLTDSQRSVIEKRYLFGETLTDAEEKRLSRAIEAATRALNWRTEGRGRIEREYCD